MSYEIDTKIIADASKSGQLMPYFLNENNNALFIENMAELYSQLDEEDFRSLFYQGKKIDEKVWNETKFVGSFLTTLFSNWVKIIKRSTSYFLEVEKDFPEVVDLDLNEYSLVLFYRAQEGMISKRDECILQTKSEWINNFFDWIYNEILEVGNIEELAKKYSAFLNVFVDENSSLPENPDEGYELPEEFFYNLDIMKDSIIAAMDGMPDADDEDFADPEATRASLKEEVARFAQAYGVNPSGVFAGGKPGIAIPMPVHEPEPISIKFKWQGKEVELSFPLDIKTSILEQKIDVQMLDTEKGWLAQQHAAVRETVIGLWADYALASYNYATDKESVEINWSGFGDHLRAWLRQDCFLEMKKIERKINSTYEKICANNKINSFEFPEDLERIMRVFLYIDNMSALDAKKFPLIHVENVQQQYFYALNNHNVLMQLWGSITQEKLQKTKAHKTFTRQFEVLKDKFPNFKEVIEYYSGAMYLFEQTGTPPAPVLLLGSPGLGKTHFSSELAKIVGSMMTVIPISSLSAGWVISGSAPQWKDAQMGKVATALLDGSSLSPVIVLDEIDKKNDGNFDPLGALYPLLEYQTAKEFVDEYLGFPLDASNVVWVATANSLNTIPEPILDRFVVFDIVKLNKEETIKVANHIYMDLTKGLTPQSLSEDVLELLWDKTPRQIKQILKKALAYAAVQRSQEIVLERKHLDINAKVKKIGF